MNMQSLTSSGLVGSSFQPRRSNWTSLRLLNIYRLALAAIFFAQGFVGRSPLFEIVHLTLYSWVSFAFFVLSLIWLVASWIERRGFQSQIALQIYSDSIIIILLMHACGGIASGLGMLLIIPVAIIGMLTQQSLAILFASLASLGLLAEYVYSVTNLSVYQGTSTQVGILGASLIATAFVTHNLMMRLRSSELLVQQRERDVALLSALNQEIIENLQGGVLVLNPANRILHINQAALDLLHLGEEDSISLSKDSPRLLATLESWRQNPEVSTPYLPSETGIDNVQVSFRQLESHGQLNTLVFLNDVSSIRGSMQQAKLASLGHLTASIAHEIRNPLGAISYAAELLHENQDIDESEQRMVEIINQHTSRINHIIEDILRLSRGSPTVRETIDLHVWLPRFVDDFCHSGLAEPDRVELELPEGALEIEFDAGNLAQILTNLLTNACVHGVKDGMLTIRVTREPQSRIHIEVADHGPGIDADIMDKIFDPFFTRSHRGSGLGLYIVAQLCELNDASISAQSNGDGGTSFVLGVSASNNPS